MLKRQHKDHHPIFRKWKTNAAIAFLLSIRLFVLFFYSFFFPSFFFISPIRGSVKLVGHSFRPVSKSNLNFSELDTWLIKSDHRVQEVCCLMCFILYIWGKTIGEENNSMKTYSFFPILFLFFLSYFVFVSQPLPKSENWFQTHLF